MGGKGGDCPPLFKVGGRTYVFALPPTFWHGERVKIFCTNFMRYIVLLKLKTRACHSIFGSVLGLKKDRRLLGYQMSSYCPPTSEELPTPLHFKLGFRRRMLLFTVPRFVFVLLLVSTS